MSGYVLGVDECGFGSWAGPMMVTAFAAPSESWAIEGLNDSKQLSRKARALIAHKLMRDYPTSFEIAVAESWEIDAVGMSAAWVYAMEIAIYTLVKRLGPPSRIIVDGNRAPIPGVHCEPRADGKYPCVMAASIIGKVDHDNQMLHYGAMYPAYRFQQHVGYGTPHHRAMLQANGLTPIHRRSFSPMSQMVMR